MNVTKTRFYWGASCIALACLYLNSQTAAAQNQPADISRQYRIAAGPLTQSLNQFALQSGVAMVFPSALTASKRGPALHGRYTVREGFDRLLQGSGLQAVRRDGNTYSLVAVVPQSAANGDSMVAMLDSVYAADERYNLAMDGYVATNDSTAMKSPVSLLETPQTVNVITRDQIAAQGAQSVTDAVRYTPGVLPSFGDSDTRNDVLHSRGFYLKQNLNGSKLPFGAYSTAMLRIEPYGLERIDILKGPASVMYGQNTPGGIVNMMTKQPQDIPMREVILGAGTHDRKQGAFDFTGPIDQEGRFSYRLTALARDSNGKVDEGFDRRVFIAPSFTWKLGDRTSLTVFSHYQHDKTLTDYAALPAVGSLYDSPYGKISPKSNLGQPDFDGYERRQSAIGYELEHVFNDIFTLRQNLQYNKVDVTTQASPGYMLDPTSRYLSRVGTRGQARADVLSVDTHLQADFHVGAARHTVLAGVDYMNLDDYYKFASGLYDSPLDILHPDHNVAHPELIPRIDYRQTREQLGVYLQDQIGWNQWVLTLGARYDQAHSRTLNQMAANVRSKQQESAWTGRVGLAYLFDNGLAPYLSYSTSFEPEDGTDFSGSQFKAMRGKQLEAGLKYQPSGQKSFVTLSAFEIRQRNMTTPDPDPTHTGFLVQSGEARVRGLEIEAKANVSKSLDVIASYAYLNSRMIKANEDAAGRTLQGKSLERVPRHQAALWVEYSPISALHLAAGVRYQGSNFGDADSTLALPARTLVDASIRYDAAHLSPALKGMTLQLTASNLFNKEYVGYCLNSIQCFYGQGRTVNASLRYKW